MVSARNALHVLLLLLAAALAGCGSAPPKPTVIQTAVEVDAGVNPDVRGRASPVILRVLELKSLAAFEGADFFSLFDRDKETLGAELVGREEYILQPGEKKRFERTLQPETRFVGVVAAFRDLERARWRAATAVVPNKTTPLVIKLEPRAVSIAP